MKTAKYFSTMFFFIIMSILNINSYSKEWQVGIGKTYSKPSEVSSLVHDDDTVTIEAGIYDGDVASWYANRLLLRGIGNVQLKANGNSAEKKAIWVIKGNDCIVDGIEFYDCIVPDRNGAGIRGEGTNLTMRHCKFMNNQMGMLCGVNMQSTIIVEYCEFAYSGYGDGLSHGIYIGHVGALIYRFNYAHHTKIGHEIKSRAAFNYIAYNRITNENGTASRNIDLANGGTSFIIGNIIHKGANTENGNIIGYGLEGIVDSMDNSLYINANTIISDRSINTFLRTHDLTDTVKINNNIIVGTGTLLIGKSKYLDTTNGMHWLSLNEARLQNPSAFDYTLLSDSPCRNKYKIIDTIYSIFSYKNTNLQLNPRFEYRDTCKYSMREASTSLGALESELIPSSIQDFGNNTLKVFPNPASEFISIQSPLYCNHVDFYSFTGFHYSTLNPEKGFVNTSELPSGIYIVSSCGLQQLVTIRR